MKPDKKCDKLGFYWQIKDLDDISMLFLDIWWFNFYLRFANVLLSSIGFYSQYLIVIYLYALDQFSHAFL